MSIRLLRARGSSSRGSYNVGIFTPKKNFLSDLVATMSNMFKVGELVTLRSTTSGAVVSKWKCKNCGYEYECDGEELPADFVCPICGPGPEMFERIE